MKGSLRQHKYQVHSDKHLHECKTCGSSFRTSSILKNHLLTHIEKSFCCPKCKKEFIMSIIKQSSSMVIFSLCFAFLRHESDSRITNFHLSVSQPFTTITTTTNLHTQLFFATFKLLIFIFCESNIIEK